MNKRIAATIIALALSARAVTANASGIDPTRISLPKGPASIEGLGRNFVPSLSSGTSAYGVDIAVPPAVAGFGPKISLDYDSGGGVSELGMGWKLGGLPTVRRRTENGLPKFDTSDAFEVTGLGVTSDLLQIADNTYRPEQEGGSFIRVKRSSDGNTWEVREKSGFTYRFGGDGCAESENGKVATWLLCERDDLHGHNIKYTWDTTNGTGLLQTITWNGSSDAARLTIKITYESRPDVIERFSAGIRQTLSKRISRIDVLRGKDTVRSYALSYDNTDNHSRLVKVRMTGTDGVTAMPELSFEYTKASLAAAGQITTMTSPPGRSTADKDVTLADLNGDSLPDLLVGKAGAFITYLNHDGTAWKPSTSWSTGNSPSVSLSSAGVQLADIDGDGAIDLVVKSGTDSFRYLPAVDDQHFGTAVTIATVPNFTFEDPDVRLADMDGDRRTDVVITTAAGLAIGYNLNGKDWTTPQTIGVVDSKQTLRFSDGKTQICDINGDRVQDLCYLRSGGLIYYLGRGRGIFEAGREATGVPDYDASSPWQLVDLNGDGWTDLVHVGVNQVDFTLATAAGVFGTPGSITGTPSKLSTTQVEFADMNGSGSTDIVWIDVSGSADQAWRYLELFPNGRAGLLKTIDNGLGKVTRIAYAAAARGAARSRDDGTPWTTRMNVGMPVVSEVRLESALGDPTIVTDYDYNNGTWDPSERTFAGFGEGIQTELGDSSTPTLVNDNTFDTGVITRVMRGQPLTSEQRDTTGTIFNRTTNGYTARNLETSLDGRKVHYAFRSSEQVEHIEGKDTSAERITLTEWEQDQYGNVTKESKWGEVVNGEKLSGNDEAITVRTYANNTDDWLLGYLASEELQDASGTRLKLTRHYYDGEAFEGLALGKVARGDLARRESWIATDHFADEVANEYDSDGNVTAALDARGSRVEYEYDHESRAFVVKERRFFGDSGSLLWQAQHDARFGVVTQLVGPTGAKTSVTYDELGRVTTLVRPGDSADKPTVSFAYEFGVPTSIVTTRQREQSGQDGVIMRLAHIDGSSRERAVFNEGSAQGEWILSKLTRLDARGQVTFTAYPTAERSADYPSVVGDRAGTEMLRDALGRTIAVRQPDGAQSQKVYGPMTLVTFDEDDTDPSSPHYNTPTTQKQDGLGRTVQVIEQDGTARITSGAYVFDAAANLLSFTNSQGHTNRYTYDGRGRRIATNDFNAGNWSFEYSDGNDLQRRVDPTGNVVRFFVDGLGRAIEEWHQLAGADERKVNELHYDAPSPDHPELGNTTGQLSWVTDEAGAEYYGYDSRGRLSDTIRRWSDGTEHYTWTDYDAQDRVIRRGFPNATHLATAYDRRGMLSAIGPFATSVKWTPDGALSSLHLGNGVDDSRSYDQRHRLVALSASDASGTVLRSLKYSLDSASHVQQISDLRASPSAEEDLTASFTLDDRYRLKTAEYRVGRTEWQLDDVTKVLSVKSTIGDAQLNVTNVYGENGAPSDQLTHHGSEALKYDAAGRLVQDGERSLTWDAKGRLAKVTRGDIEESYAYGHDDERVLKTTKSPGLTEVTRYIDKDVEERNGDLIRYAFIGGLRAVRLDATDAGPRTAPVTTTSNAGAARHEPPAPPRHLPPWVWLSAALIAAFASTVARLRQLPGQTRWAWIPALTALGLGFGISTGMPGCHSTSEEGKPGIRASSKEITDVPISAEFYLGDIQGTPVVVLDAKGQVVSRSAYHPYGHVRYQTSSHRDPFGFVANEEDRGSGLSDFHARAYRPELGAFLSVDPIALFSPEQIVGQPSKAYAYAYGEGNPIDNADPEGKQCSPYAMPGEPKNDQAYNSAKAHAIGETLKGAWNAIIRELAGRPAVIPYAFPEAQRQAAEQAETRANAAEAAVGFSNVSREGRIAGAVLVTIAETVIVGKLTNTASRTTKAATRITKAGAASPRVALTHTTVLGKFPDYLKLSDEIGAARFSMPTQVWNKMTSAQQWAANQKFLDRAISRGDNIILSNPVKSIDEATGSYGRELRYLADKGFKLNNDGTRMVR